MEKERESSIENNLCRNETKIKEKLIEQRETEEQGSEGVQNNPLTINLKWGEENPWKLFSSYSDYEHAIFIYYYSQIRKINPELAQSYLEIYKKIIENASSDLKTQEDAKTELDKLLNLLKGDKFTGKVVTIQETQTSHQALESLYDLDYMDMAQLISDKYKIEFEKSRLKNENRDISDEDIYLPDGLEVLLHNIKQCKINGKKERISFNDLSGNCIVINRKYYDTYTVSIGNEEKSGRIQRTFIPSTIQSRIT